MSGFNSLILLLFCFSCCSVVAQSPPENILFVGNSYTYYWNLPQQLAAMAESQDIQLSCHQSTIGGANLGQHWRGDRELKTVEYITSSMYDAVILQDHSRRSIEHPDSLQHFGELLGELAQQKEARVFLYMTWAREWDPYMMEPIQEQYMSLAKRTGARVIPVGPAWARARVLRPDIRLYHEDGSHPSNVGTYLTACVMFAVLTARSPVGLTHRLMSEDKHGQKLYLNILTPENARFCQKVAEEIVGEFAN
ncbi:MAG: hypothetical protein AAF587_40035 [Bacteroidota bacterium]